MFSMLDVGRIFGYPVARILRPMGGVERPYDMLAEIERGIKEIDLVCFGGGADIHPSLYQHKNVMSNQTRPSERDLFEVQVWNLCQKYKIPVLGICRGSQFVCAMSGGSLIQDNTPHGYAGDEHPIITNTGKTLKMTSTHHQMMWPGKARHELIAWHENIHGTSQWLYDTQKLQIPYDWRKDIEIVHFPLTNALGIQGHPEYYNDLQSETVQYCQDLVNRYLFGE